MSDSLSKKITENIQQARSGSMDPNREARREAIEIYTKEGAPLPQEVRQFLTNEAKSLSPFEIRQASKGFPRPSPRKADRPYSR